ncbi:tetratricopeptide repeat protein [Streptomyces sp. HC44]|uniref:Tetratricopeptide repeat protein n=2 Tax=Streptomyces scabichelini TaxID=2711217 RepID=A0A6G4VCZ3_9ACTN|nr:tetratricopeptide repeat protein [Streptomyces scabichelini]
MVESVSVWAAGETGRSADDRIRALSELLAEQAAAQPSLARELRNWLTTVVASGEPSAHAGHEVANAIGTAAEITGTVVQAGDIRGGVHIHPVLSDPTIARAPAVPRQLPPVPVHFTNRRRELAELDGLTASSRDGPVIAVISGPAGVGKTALARRWLRSLAEVFPDGQLYADLRGHSVEGPARPSELLAEFLRAFGHTRIPAELDERAALWRSVTAGTRIALLLDNVLSAAQVRPLLPGTTHALTAVTSRSRLTGLGMDGATFHPLDVFATGDAVELLSRRVGVERVRKEPEAALAMAKACAGLPLAMCVAAARAAARPRQPLAVMAGALGDEGGSALDALRVEGKYAVRAALDESYRLLTPEVARGYRRLSLAPVPLLTPPVAAAACAVPAAEAERLLDELAEVNLVEDLGPELRTGLGRYRFHDLIRAHAEGLAGERETPADMTAVVRRVVHFYLSAATSAESLLTPSHRTLPRDYARPPAPPPFSDAPGALRWLDAERLHLMAVLRTAAKRNWHALAWQLADAMWPAFLRLRPYDMWIEAHEIGLAAAREAGHREGVRRMLTSGGAGLRNVGRYQEAVAWFSEALETAQEDMARRDEAQALHGLGQTHRLAGRLAEAHSYFGRALALREAMGYRRGAALTRLCLGDTALAADRPDEAVPYLTRARQDLLAEDDHYDAARALAYLGRAEALRTDGSQELAEHRLRQSLAEFEIAGSVHWQGRVLEMLGEGAEERGDSERAGDWYEKSLARYATVSESDKRRLENRLRNLGSS